MASTDHHAAELQPTLPAMPALTTPSAARPPRPNLPAPALGGETRRSAPPEGSDALSGISLRAFLLGTTLGSCVCITAFLILHGHPLWRIPMFIATLSVFHYLEFDMTARHNPSEAQISSFLLNNGWAYNVAHGVAMLECGSRWYLRDTNFTWLPRWFALPDVLPTTPSSMPIALGVLLILSGQMVRSLAMRTAATSFNHIVQRTRKTSHVLVTGGVYGWCRHPSYLGFFWWSLGTQLVMCNTWCLLIYTGLLWKFFSMRIARASVPT